MMKHTLALCLSLLVLSPASQADTVADQATTASQPSGQAANLNDAFCTAGTPCAVVKQRNAGLH
jgi:hypothetical protein